MLACLGLHGYNEMGRAAAGSTAACRPTPAELLHHLSLIGMTGDLLNLALLDCCICQVAGLAF